METSKRLPSTGAPGIALRQRLAAKLIGHKQHIEKHGLDGPENRDWRRARQGCTPWHPSSCRGIFMLSAQQGLGRLARPRPERVLRTPQRKAVHQVKRKRA